MVPYHSEKSEMIEVGAMLMYCNFIDKLETEV